MTRRSSSHARADRRLLQVVDEVLAEAARLLDRLGDEETLLAVAVA